MKKLFCISFLLLFAVGYSQKTITIKVSIPNQNDVVYITGNQDALGNWNASQVKMEKTSGLERSITLPLKFPAELKFTRGSWDTEGISNNLESNPNFIIANADTAEVSFRVKGWKDNIASEESVINFKIERIKSKYFENKERLVKVYLPENYNPAKKYPVLYVLDGFELFEKAAIYTKQLTLVGSESPDNIPACIVVGVFHENRRYETSPDFTTTKYQEGPENLNQFLTKEVMPMINAKYAVSGYNILAGHSNTAHFVVNELFQDGQPFNGIISLSLNGQSDFVKQRLYNYLKSAHQTNVFLGYGMKDLGFNEISKYIEQELQAGNLSGERLKVGKYNATHNQMPAVSLFDGIRFMFDGYRNFEDYETAITRKDFNLFDYSQVYAKRMRDTYGIDAPLNDVDLSYLLETAVANKNVAVFNQAVSYYETQLKTPYSAHLNFFFNKEMGQYETAKKYAYVLLASKDENDHLILNGNADKYADLFAEKLKKPEEGIAFFEKAIRLMPQFELRFRYFIAKTAIAHHIQKTKAKSNLKYCLANYKENGVFSVSDMKLLESKL